MSDSTWPELEWIVPAQRVNWLLDRTKQLGVRTRAFELALEQSAEAGEAPLSKITEDLDHWEHLAATIWMYVGLGESKQVAAEDVGAHAEELAKVYANLRERRGVILEKLAAAAPKILAREAAAKVDDKHLKDRAGELPSFQEEVNALGAHVAQVPISTGDEQHKPVTPEELRQRLAQESKPLPDATDFKSLLGALPPPWINALFETLGLELPEELTRRRDLDDEDDEDAEVELTANSKSTIQKKILQEKIASDDLLREVLFALEDEDRALLGDMLAAGGSLKYGDATAKYGKDDADGFFWMERTASGTVARLRRVGLAFVGMKAGKQLLQLPGDLTARIAAILNAPTPDDEEPTVV